MSTRYIIDSSYVTKQRRDNVEGSWENIYKEMFNTPEHALFGQAIRDLETRIEKTNRAIRISELKRELKRLEEENE